jgi:hypothetical protein
MKRKIFIGLLAIVLLAGFMGCVTLQQKWDKATDDERARIVVSQTQKSLKLAFISTQTFVGYNPKYKDDWKNRVLPMFEVTNNILGDLIKKGQAGEKLTYLQIMAAVGGRVMDIIVIIENWGVKTSELQNSIIMLSVLNELEERRM